MIKKRLEIARHSRLRLFNAHTPTLLPSLQAGAGGFSGIGANFFPELYVWLCRNFNESPDLSLGLQNFMTECCEIMEGEYYPITAKEYLRQQGLNITSFCRTKTTKLPSCVLETLSKLHDDADEWMQKIE